MSSQSSLSLKSLLALTGAALAQLTAPGGGSVSSVGDCILVPEADTIQLSNDEKARIVPIEFDEERWKGICTHQAGSGKTFLTQIKSSDGTVSQCVLPGYISSQGRNTFWVRDVVGDRQGVYILTNPLLSEEETEANRVVSEQSHKSTGSTCSDFKCTSALTCLQQDKIPREEISKIEKDTADYAKANSVSTLEDFRKLKAAKEKHDEL